MGKPTGFMEYQRQDCHVIPPEEHWQLERV